MTDLQNREHCPTLDELGAYIRNPLFPKFCGEVMETSSCRAAAEFSACSWEKGWNVKFKKAGRTLCTVYPRENYFTVLLVVGRKEKTPFEEILPGCCPALREIYASTREGNGQRWLMVDLEDGGELYRDVFRFLAIRGAR